MTDLPKTPEQWRALLASKGAEPLAYEVTRQAATERAFTGRYEQKANTTASAVMPCCLMTAPSLTRAAVGPAFTKARSRVPSKIGLTEHTVWCVPSRFAPNVAPI